MTYFAATSLSVVDGRPIAVNSTFESILGPFYKFGEWEFADAASEDVTPAQAIATRRKEANRSRFRDAINKVRIFLTISSPDERMELYGNGKKGLTVKVRNVEMLTLGTNEAGLPVRKYFDWTIGTMQLDSALVNVGESTPSSAVILWGDLVNEEDSSNR